MSAFLERITIYPIKSLDGVTLDEANVLPGGALEFDRRFALVDLDRYFINGKRTAAVHNIRATFDLAEQTVQLRTNADANAETFSLVDDFRPLSEWFTQALKTTCTFVENAQSGFPDDTESPGPTLISTTTLETVASWFPGLSLDETRRRFRANLEVGGVESFWDDRLVGSKGTHVPFNIGDMHFFGVTACQRCVVPTRASDTGEATPLFQKTLATRREATLPPWATPERFDHFYRLAVNTRLATGHGPGRLRVGDGVSLR